MDRREFVKKSAALGASAMLSPLVPTDAAARLMRSNLQDRSLDIAVVDGADYYGAAVRAVEMLGGMSKFVSRGASVGVLVNSPWPNPGTYTNPDVALAVVQMCFDAGAEEVLSVEGASASYWERSSLASRHAEVVAAIRPSGEKDLNIEIPNGKALKRAEICRPLIESDVLINVPIVKDHSGTRFTCTMKNVMGGCAPSTNRFFHFGGGAADWYDDVEHLSQCIADLSLVRRPDLCVVDATEFVTTNGPRGPGRLSKPEKVVAGTDTVAVDAFCAKFLGFNAVDVPMIRMAYEHGLGEMDLGKLNIEAAAV